MSRKKSTRNGRAYVLGREGERRYEIRGKEGEGKTRRRKGKEKKGGRRKMRMTKKHKR